MAGIRERPIRTLAFDHVGDFCPEPNSTYFYGTFEERSEHGESWRAAARAVNFVKLHESGRTGIRAEPARDKELSVRDLEGLSALVRSFGQPIVYIDVTGLSHHVWAPLLRACYVVGVDVRCVYVEPEDYKVSDIPNQGQIHDLSERIEGVAPIPGFASFAPSPEEEVCFVPLLGFEGVRFAYLLERVQPLRGQVFPVVGVPGFRLEYPFYAYHGNQSALTDTHAWKNVRYARANCPFSLFYTIKDIAESHQNQHILIAPIGTKPHSIGAILFALYSSKHVELVYDHPKRKLKRTRGAAKCLVYPIADFLSSLA